MMKLTSLFFLLFIGFYSVAQTTVQGTVYDQTSKQAIPYATIKAIDIDDTSNFSGVISGEDGSFLLQTNQSNFYLEFSFIGFESLTINDFEIKNGMLNLGEVYLKQDAEALEEVVVEGEQSRTVFELDKRVFHVGKDLSSSGASALDVLNNVPSVQVDIEGQISLRGSQGVQILINGKPSVMATDESNALGTITADMIESIEVITNPSAKYEAEGTAGIINIVMKKDERKGINGSVSINTGIPDNHSIGLSLNKRSEKFNLFTQMGLGYRSLPREHENVNTNKGEATSIFSDGEEFRDEKFYNLILGSDFYLNKTNTFTLTGSYAFEDEQQPSKTTFRREVNGTTTDEWYREEETEADNPKWQFEFNYSKDFKKEDSDFIFSVIGSFFGKEQFSDFDNLTNSGEVFSDPQQTETAFDEARYTFKADYRLPITDEFSFETGSQYFINNVGNEFTVRDFTNGAWVPDLNQTNDFEFDQKVLGVYSTGAYEGEKWGAKLGLRLENTDLRTLLVTTNEANDRNYTDLFPSAHTSYKFSENFSLQAGYSRRIYRPRLWDLNPFFNIRNNFNIRAGNPNLQAEYTDSYEFTAINYFGKQFSINYGLFHRYTTDVIERITFFEDNVTTTMPENIGTDKTTGIEINTELKVSNWLSTNADFNLNFFNREGQFEDMNFDFDGDRANARLVSKFKLPKDFDLEVTGNFNSRYKTVQGEMSENLFADFGARKKLMKGKGIINLSVRDVFRSRFREHTIDNTEVYQYHFGRRGRFFALGFSYGFGKGEAMEYSGRRRR